MEESKREELLNQIEQKAHDYERDYHGCSQSALLTLQETFGLGDGPANMAATSLVGGIALRGDTCGAVIGCLMGLNMVFGREKMENWAELLRSLRHARAFCRGFEAEFGSLQCRDLQQSMFGRTYNMADVKEYQEFEQAGGYQRCPVLVGKAARIAAEIILEKAPEKAPR